MSDKGGIEFEFPLIPTEEELRKMRKEQTREKLFIIDGTTKDIKEHLSNKGWEKVNITITPASNGREADEYHEIMLREFSFRRLGLQADGVLVKDTDEVVIFHGNFTIMADFVGRNAPGSTDLPDYTKCTISITKCEELL